MMLLYFFDQHYFPTLILQFEVDVQVFYIPLFLNLDFFDHNRKASIETLGLQVIIEPKTKQDQVGLLNSFYFQLFTVAIFGFKLSKFGFVPTFGVLEFKFLLKGRKILIFSFWVELTHSLASFVRSVGLRGLTMCVSDGLGYM